MARAMTRKEAVEAFGDRIGDRVGMFDGHIRKDVKSEAERRVWARMTALDPRPWAERGDA